MNGGRSHGEKQRKRNEDTPSYLGVEGREMKDYRTWWRRGHDLHGQLSYMMYFFKTYKMPKSIETYDDGDCVWEQLWAIREGLA